MLDAMDVFDGPVVNGDRGPLVLPVPPRKALSCVKAGVFPARLTLRP
jgi:hypothetical protein